MKGKSGQAAALAGKLVAWRAERCLLPWICGAGSCGMLPFTYRGETHLEHHLCDSEE